VNVAFVPATTVPAPSAIDAPVSEMAIVFAMPSERTLLKVYPPSIEYLYFAPVVPIV
jgi:hypothetical protein